MSRMLTWLAKSTPSADGQVALLAQPDLHDALAENPQLADEPWERLWAAKPPASRAVKLVSGPAAARRAGAVLARERRLSVLRTLLTASTVSYEDGAALLDAGRVDRETAWQWTHAGTVPVGLEGRVAHLAGGVRLVRYLLAFPDAPDAGDDVALPLLTTEASWSHTFADLMDARPHLLPAMLASETPLAVHLACTSRHLVDQDVMLAVLADPSRPPAMRARLAMELALNPNAGERVLIAASREIVASRVMSTSGSQAARARIRIDAFCFAIQGPWEDATDERDRQLLALLADDGPGRRAFLAGLGVVPALPELRSVTVTTPTRPAPVRAPFPPEVLLATPVNGTGRGPSLAEVSELVARELDELGPQAWQLAVTLLADGFDEPAGVLLDVCRHM